LETQVPHFLWGKQQPLWQSRYSDLPSGNTRRKRKDKSMRYIQPTILRTDSAARAIQSVGKPDNEKPVGGIVDNAQTKLTTSAAYEADE
jgi:hypothetical protein